MGALLRDIARGAPIEGRVVIVAAHPDDEILALGSRLETLRDLLVVHLTDGAPRDLVDARREGWSDAAGYAAARRDELRAAMAAAGAGSAALRCYGFPDQKAILDCASIARRLEGDLAGARAIFTHSYEHGHPDHDTAALAVALACDRLAAEARAAPEHYEFPSYHLRHGEPVFGAFWHDPGAPETVLPLTEDQRRRKAEALACFVTQARVIGCFPLGDERLRKAPRYDFRALAPPREAFYDAFGWEMTSRGWLGHAAAALEWSQSWQAA